MVVIVVVGVAPTHNEVVVVVAIADWDVAIVIVRGFIVVAPTHTEVDVVAIADCDVAVVIVRGVVVVVNNVIIDNRVLAAVNLVHGKVS